MVGPDFHAPTEPNVKNYTSTPLSKQTAGTAGVGSSGQSQAFVFNQAIPAQWWSVFRSKTLDDLIRTGLANSPTVAAAQGTLRQAQETLNAQIGTTYFPAVSGQFTSNRQRFAGASFGGEGFPSSTFELYNASVDVSYTLDLFGSARRQVEALGAEVDYQNFELEATYLTLAGNIVTTAITNASLKAQIQATKELIQAQETQLTIVEKQNRLGGASGADVLAQQTQLAQTRATLPPLEKSLAQTRHALSVLVGAYPSQQQPEVELNQLYLPSQLPVSLPSALVRQRPDIRASEALLHAASAQVGVATANLFPKINLTGSVGNVSNKFSNLFAPNNNVWNLGGQLLQPLFQGGALQANRRAAVAAFEAAGAQYKQTVLKAFQNVADTLRALETDAQALRAQQQAETAALSNLNITQKQFKLGGVSYIALLNAQQQYQQTRVNRIQAQAMRYTDTAALFQALGGGWWNQAK